MGGDSKNQMTVIGAGDMGHGIAEVGLLCGLDVSLYDIKQEFLDRGVGKIKESLTQMAAKGKIGEKDAQEMVRQRLHPSLDLAGAVGEAFWVIEAAPEILGLKKELFGKLDQLTRKEAILASNTSNMSITQLGAMTRKPDKVVGLHFFNPAVVMKLVEVIRGEKTSSETMQLGYDLCLKMGKVPVRVEKDRPGFIVNRVQAPRGVLLGAILDQGVAEPEEVDAKMKAIGMPMGPFELMDYVGIDVAYYSALYRAEALHPDYAPAKGVVEKVKAGRLGKKTGAGFYDWSKGRPQIDPAKATDKVDPLDFLLVTFNEATRAVEEGVATPADIDLAIENGSGSKVGPIKQARGLDPKFLTERLEALSRNFGKEIFRPTRTIREGLYRNWGSP